MDRESTLLHIPNPENNSKDNREYGSADIETHSELIGEDIRDLCADDTDEYDTYPVYRWTVEFFAYL